MHPDESIGLTTMKYVIIIPDGCADEPLESLSGKTPLQAANIPAMDEIAATGHVGKANHVPAHLPAGSDVANMSLLGYDPNEFFSGRAPLEAAAQGIQLGPYDWAIRCNLVTIQDQIMNDFTANHISTEEATELLQFANSKISDSRLEFIPGVSYRNLLVYRGSESDQPFTMETRHTAPHDLTDKSVSNDYPRGPGSDLLVDLMNQSVEWFCDHPVNQQRASRGQLPATNVWLWGLGRTPALTPFTSTYGPRGRMITAVDLLRGLAKLIDWSCIEVPGATGYLDTDYGAKGRAAIEAIQQENVDLVCVHIEATDEASHEGRVDAKIEALQEIDRHIVRPLWELRHELPEVRYLVTPDHPTPIHLKTHSHGFVPYAMAGAGIESEGANTYDEVSADESKYDYPGGWKLMGDFLGNTSA